jgi:hypothetical protein
MEIVRETIASSGRMLKDKAMASSIFPRRRRVRQRVARQQRVSLIKNYWERKLFAC